MYVCIYMCVSRADPPVWRVFTCTRCSARLRRAPPSPPPPKTTDRRGTHSRRHYYARTYAFYSYTWCRGRTRDDVEIKRYRICQKCSPKQTSVVSLPPLFRTVKPIIGYPRTKARARCTLAKIYSVSFYLTRSLSLFLSHTHTRPPSSGIYTS